MRYPIAHQGVAKFFVCNGGVENKFISLKGCFDGDSDD